MAKFGFDLSEVDVNEISSGGNYEPIPAGEYSLKALEAEEKTTASGGTMIKVKYEVTKGEHAGRWIWNNFNVVNKSEVAQKIARQQLVAWGHACGKPECDDTDKLIEKPFKGAVIIQKGTGGYKDSNSIAAFLMATDSEAPAAKPAAKAAPAKVAAFAAKAANPWD